MPTLSPQSTFRRLLGLVPRTVPPHVFEVDETRLGYTRLTATTQGFEPTAGGEVDLPEGVFVRAPLGASLRSTEGLGRAIRELCPESAPERASVVLPDGWLRLLFADLEAGGGAVDEEVLRFKLKRLVPFRVEELRVRGVEVPALGRAEGSKRLLLAFAAEGLLGEIERTFARCGVRVGQITSRSLALINLLTPTEEGQLLVHVEPEGVSIVLLFAGRPWLVRYRSLRPDLIDDSVRLLVASDLRTIRSFVEASAPGPLAVAWLCAEPELEASWRRQIAASFELEPRPLDQLAPTGASLPERARPWAPVLGAASQRVS